MITPHPIAFVHQGWEKTEDEANARLIAAAPDLLQACKMALEWAAEYPKYREWAFILKARGAIAAIEGKE